MDISSLSLQEAQTGLSQKKFSSTELVTACLHRIKKFNPKLNSFITVRDKEALKEAKKIDSLKTKPKNQPLLGIPIAIKDNFLTQGIRTTSASLLLDDFVPQFAATVVNRLKAAGAIIIGKTNLDAWGHGSSGEHTDYGVTHNPYAYDRVTGGSSSGSGAAVASDMCFAATGSDTGGSNRQPGSYCNIVGLKQTYGRVSRYGVIPMASSTDCMGHLTKTVWDSSLLLSITAGFDPYDATSADIPVEPYHQQLSTSASFKIGVPQEFFSGLNPKLASIINRALKVLAAKGHKLVDISLPILEKAYPIYCLTTFPEISSNLSRFDGIRYGFGRDRFADEPRRRIMIGTHALSAGYQGRYYKQASKCRTLMLDQFDQAFSRVDLIAGPVFPFPPFHHQERELDPLLMYLSDVLTVPASITGLPAISVPIEFVDNLPNGLQIIAPHFQETRMFQLAYQVENEYQMYKVKPQLKS